MRNFLFEEICAGIRKLREDQSIIFRKSSLKILWETVQNIKNALTFLTFIDRGSRQYLNILQFLQFLLTAILLRAFLKYFYKYFVEEGRLKMCEIHRYRVFVKFVHKTIKMWEILANYVKL